MDPKFALIVHIAHGLYVIPSGFYITISVNKIEDD